MGKRCQQGDKKKPPRLLRLQGLGHVVFSIKPASEAESKSDHFLGSRAGQGREAAGRGQGRGGRSSRQGAAGFGVKGFGSRV